MSITIGGSSSKVTAFELNAMLVLQRDGTNYSYWIQDGLHLDASSNQYSIGGAYVWNFSGPGAGLVSGEVQGAVGSSLIGDTYYFIPNCAASFPGQCSTLSLPATLLGRIVSSTSAGLPYVDFEYNVGSRWVTYDNVSFLHMGNASDSGFLVDGFSHVPYSAGLYYDAEWDWVAAGGGASGVDQGSDIDLSLGFWNGHNYQAVPTAWNFGANTGETSSNVSVSLAAAPTLEPAAHLASGSGAPGPLYNQDEVGFVNVSVPTVLPETLVADGVPVPFSGGWANLTLPGGVHSIYLQNYSNASTAVTIVPGATTLVNLSGAGRLAFTESGLPGGTPWGVSLNGSTNVSVVTAGRSVVLNLPNGTYSVGYSAVPGYYRNGSDPATVSLPGSTQIDIVFAVFTYRVSVTESGLPNGTSWWLKVNGGLTRGSGITLEASVPNGTTPFEVGASYDFIPTPQNGTLRVAGGLAVPVSVEFAYRPSYIDGTVEPSSTQVTVEGVVQATGGGSFEDLVIPGNYTVVASATGYVTQTVRVTTTPGNISWANFSLEANQSTGPPPTSPTPASSGSPLSTYLFVAVVAVAAVAAVSILVWALRRR